MGDSHFVPVKGQMVSNWVGLRLHFCFLQNVVLLSSLGGDLQQALGWFAVNCKAARMRISTFKSQAMLLSWKKIDCPLKI